MCNYCKSITKLNTEGPEVKHMIHNAMQSIIYLYCSLFNPKLKQRRGSLLFLWKCLRMHQRQKSLFLKNFLTLQWRKLMETLLLEAENFKKGGWFLLYLLFVKNLKTILAFQLFKDAPLVKDILCLFPLSHSFFCLTCCNS